MRSHGMVLHVLIVTFACVSAGCTTTANLIDGTAAALSNKAREIRVAQAHFSDSMAERREARQAKCPDDCKRKDRSGKLCHHDGELQETMETELKMIMENGLELSGYQLDFKKVQELAKEQARYDEEYDEAMKAWHAYEEENYRRHAKSEMEKAKATADAAGGQCTPCAPVLPNCATPPPKNYVKSAPPKRNAVGLNEIPIVIHANAKLNLGNTSYGKSQIRRELVKEKKPCCPRCGTADCNGTCEACGYITPLQAAGPHEPVQAPGAAEPAAAPPIGQDD